MASAAPTCRQQVLDRRMSAWEMVALVSVGNMYSSTSWKKSH